MWPCCQDDAKFDGFDSTRSLQISGISVGLNASGSTSVEQKEDRDVAAEVSAAIRAAEHEEHPAMAEARARESRPGSQAEARTEPEEEDGVAPATLDEVLEASPQLQDTGSGNQQTRAGSGDDDEVLVRKEKKKKKKKKRRRKQQLASDDDSGPATTDTRNSDPSAEESKEDTSVPESDGNTGTSDLGEPQTERRRRSSRPHRKDRSRSRSRSRSRTRSVPCEPNPSMAVCVCVCVRACVCVRVFYVRHAHASSTCCGGTPALLSKRTCNPGHRGNIAWCL